MGLRWGAVLAAHAAARGLETQDLVLWEPAVDGASHVAELRAIEAIRFRHFAPLARGVPGELLGYPLDPAQAAEMAALDLRRLGQLPAARILIFAARARPEHQAIAAALCDRAGRPPERHLVAEDADQHHDGVLLSIKVLQAMSAAVGGGVP
jgi:hypothetical protein